MTRTTVFLIMDAGRTDYVTPTSMPFLHALRARSVRAEFESPPGFAQRTVLFSGRYPDTSGNFSQFVFDPALSPFAWVKRLGPIANVLRPRRVMYPARWAIAKLTGRLTGTYFPDPAWIPPKYMPFFRPCEDMKPVHDPGALGATSIYDLCRSHGRTYRYIGHPLSGDDERVTDALVHDLRNKATTDLFVGQLCDTDHLGHQVGPDSDEMRNHILPKMDGQIARIHEALSANYDDWDLFVVGDHGMAAVNERVDLVRHLKAAKARPAKDYVLFVNSTLALFWYLTERGRREIEAILPNVPGTTVVEDALRRDLRIPTEPRWGHRMLAANPGVLFWPDYFHVTDTPIVGMHGYLDKSTEAFGAGVLASSGARPVRDVGHRALVDVFPTLCDLLDVPIPTGQEGTSLLRPARAPPEAARVRARPSPLTAAAP